MKSKLTVGFVQQPCGDASVSVNLDLSIQAIRKAKNQGAELVVLPELHLGPYFCQTEDTSRFDLAESIPGPTTETLGRVAAELEIVIVASLFEKGLQGFTTIPLSFLKRTVDSLVSTGKCIFPMIRGTTKSSISLRVTWGSSLLRPQLGCSVCWFVGINGIRRQRG